MIPHLFVIDEFLPNPEAVRAKALTMDFSIRGRYPDLNSVEKIGFPWLDAAISRIVGEPVRAPWTEDFSHGSCRLALAADDKPARIHIDQSDWTGVLSLTRPEDCRGGTEFYRHLPTNTDRCRSTRSDCARPAIRPTTRSRKTFSTGMRSTGRNGSCR